MAIILLLSGSGNAATLTVNASGGANYTVIQDAVNAASAGDTILVYSGLYNESVNVNKRLTLKGVDDGGGKPIIDANGLSINAVTISAKNSEVENFDVGKVSAPYYSIYVTSSNNTIKNIDTTIPHYGVVYLYYSNNNMLYNCSSTFYLHYSNNNTLIKTVESSDLIKLFFSNNNTLHDINTPNIVLENSNNNTLTSIGWIPNIIDSSISLSYSNNNTLSRNNASIYLRTSNNNTINENNISNKNEGIKFDVSNNNRLIRNTLNFTKIGIQLDGNNNFLSENYAYNNEYGISVQGSKNILINNIMINNKINFQLNPGTLIDEKFDNSVDITNLVEGKPIYYIKNAVSMEFNSSTNAGVFYCIRCVNVTIKDLNLNKNDVGVYFWKTINSNLLNLNISDNNYGFVFWYSNNNILSDNNVSNNQIGIHLFNSNNNTLNRNKFDSQIEDGLRMENNCFYNNLNENIFSNNHRGIFLYVLNNKNIISGNRIFSNDYGIRINSKDNLVYNNFFNNSANFESADINTWNIVKTPGMNIIGNPYLGGNIWANPSGTGFSQTCIDEDNDGICDSPYTFYSNVDHLPLSMKILDTTRGDVNRNSIRDTGDATLILRYLVELPTPSEYLPILPIGDMNCNGIIDTGDATLILRDIVGLDIPRCWE